MIYDSLTSVGLQTSGSNYGLVVSTLNLATGSESHLAVSLHERVEIMSPLPVKGVNDAKNSLISTTLFFALKLVYALEGCLLSAIIPHQGCTGLQHSAACRYATTQRVSTLIYWTK